MATPVNLNLLGVDIATDKVGDVAIDVDDFATISGVENVINAFVREIVTPFGHLARFAYDIEGLKAVDEDYGNVAYFQLSEPLTTEWIAKMLDHLKEVAESQARISVSSIDYTILTETVGHIKFFVRFEVLSYPKSYNLVLTNEGDKLAAVVEEV